MENEKKFTDKAKEVLKDAKESVKENFAEDIDKAKEDVYVIPHVLLRPYYSSIMK